VSDSPIAAGHGFQFGGAAPTPAPLGQADIPAQIARLADLHAQGILSDAEFSAKKTDLLARM
jgi:hypothetical protein